MPFIIAAGFAFAAVTVVECVGHVMRYWLHLPSSIVVP